MKILKSTDLKNITGGQAPTTDWLNLFFRSASHHQERHTVPDFPQVVSWGD